MRRRECDGCVETLLGHLSDMEKLCESLELSGDSQPMKVQEKVELVRVRIFTLIVNELLLFLSLCVCMFYVTLTKVSWSPQ